MKFASTSLFIATILISGVTRAQEWKSGVEWQEPQVVTPGERNSEPPSDAVVLFDGTSMSQWENGDAWLVEDGVAIPQKGDIHSIQHFGDIQLHLEWSSPEVIEGEGQGRGNSGVFLMGLYEVQVLDSWKNQTYFDGQAAGIYKQTPPMVNAMRRPGEWNTYDIFFTAPKFRVNGDVEKPGYVTVMHNGVLVQNHFELLGPTEYTKAPHYIPHAETGPIRLQYHRDAVRFRNIWVRELNPPVGRRTGPGFNILPEVKARPQTDADDDDDDDFWADDDEDDWKDQDDDDDEAAESAADDDDDGDDDSDAEEESDSKTAADDTAADDDEDLDSQER